MHAVPRLILTALLWVVLALPASAREQIRIVGSSTVYPFAASVAEHFGKAGDFRTPVVESTGTGAGFKLFCEGAGDFYPDITDASRRMLGSERAQCMKTGVKHIIEVKIGFDGITLANSASGPLFHLTKEQIFLALARDLPKDGAMVPNFYRRWAQISPDLPDLPIKVYGTPPVSGTRDAFVELVMEKGCGEIAALKEIYKGEDERRQHCGMMREDGAFIEAGENGNLIAQKLIGDPEALGIFGFSFLDQNTGRIQGSVIDGTAPTFESIQSGVYGISRPLYFYVKGEQLDVVPGLKEYTDEFISDGAIGDEGYLSLEGLVPLPEAERAVISQEVNASLAAFKR